MLMIEAATSAAVARGFAEVVRMASGHHTGHTGLEHLAHIAAIVGMVLVLAGVVIHGARRHRRRPAAKPGGLDSHAHR